MLDELLDAAEEPDNGSSAALRHPPWTVVAARGARPEPATVPSLRRALVQLAVATTVVVTLVALVGGAISRRIAESQAVHEVARLTDVLAENVVQPALTNAMATSPAAAAALDRTVRRRVLGGSLVRVKLWAPDGRIVYSDEKRLVGARIGLDDDARAALARPQVRAEISDLSAPENRFERGQGALLEVYRPVWTPSGRPLLFETYFRYAQVRAQAGQLWRGFAGITLSSIAAIVVVLVPLVSTLVVRARRAHRQRETMLQHAMDASFAERRRIAATLHDGIVQELVAASFAVAGTAQEVKVAGHEALAARLQSAGDAVRAGIGGMRSLLVDIYPPGLREAGLVPALRDLANTVRVPVQFDIDEETARRLEPPLQEVVFRTTQECLRNAARHAGAEVVTVRLSRADGEVTLTISDDGAGFDPSTARREGHFGLALLADLARGCGAELALSTARGEGTTWRLRMSM